MDEETRKLHLSPNMSYAIGLGLDEEQGFRHTQSNDTNESLIGTNNSNNNNNNTTMMSKINRILLNKETREEIILNLMEEYSPWWRKMFLTSCVVAVSIDPLFLYIPIIKNMDQKDDNMKCFGMDTRLRNVALVLRTFTDFAYLWHIIFQILSSLLLHEAMDGQKSDHTNGTTNNSTTITAKSNEKTIMQERCFRLVPGLYGRIKSFLQKLPHRSGLPTLYGRIKSFLVKLPCLRLTIDFSAIVPIPQVIVLVFYSKMGGSRTLTSRKFLYWLLMLQYVPRILRIFLSAKDLSRDFNSYSRRVWIRAAFNFFLYIILAHVFGAFWYFHSILRLTECWHNGCIDQLKQECTYSFSCDRYDDPPKINNTALKKFCPTNPTNETVFNFGIFKDAIESNIIGTTDFPKKLMNCFWWAFRNLSSFGSNLTTIGNVWEILFVVIISIFGLLLFSYLIGNVQRFMGLATSKSEEHFNKQKTKEEDVDCFLWGEFGDDKRKGIKKVMMKYVQCATRQKKDCKLADLFSHIITDIKTISTSKNPPTKKNRVKLERCVRKSCKDWLKKLKEEIKLHKKLKDKVDEWTKDHFNEKGADILQAKIGQYIVTILKEGRDVNIANLISSLPPETKILMKKHLCSMQMLEKVPMFQSLVNNIYEKIYECLKPKIYLEDKYIIRSGEPLNFIVFIIKGDAWMFESSDTSVEWLNKGEWYGVAQLGKLRAETLFSEKNVKCYTKVEAFVLTMIDLETIRKEAQKQGIDAEHPILARTAKEK